MPEATKKGGISSRSQGMIEMAMGACATNQNNSSGLALDPSETCWIFHRNQQKKDTFKGSCWSWSGSEVNQPFIDVSTGIRNIHILMVSTIHKNGQPRDALTCSPSDVCWAITPMNTIVASIMDHSYWSLFAPYLSFGAPLYNTFTGYLDILGLRGCASASARLFSPPVSGNRWKSSPSPVVAHTLRTTCGFGAILSPCIDAPSDVCWIITPWILQLWVA